MESILIAPYHATHRDNSWGRCSAELPQLIYAPPPEACVRNTSTQPSVSKTDNSRVYPMWHFIQHQSSTSDAHETCGGNLTSNTSRVKRNVDKQLQHQSIAGNISESVDSTFVRPQRRKTTPRYGCSLCEKRFSYKCHLRVHVKIHSGIKPYSCKHCTRCFRQSGTLTVHMRRHTGVQPYECRICKRKFRHCNSLKRHQAKVHALAELKDASFDVAQKKEKSTKIFSKIKDSVAEKYHYRMDSSRTLKNFFEFEKESFNVDNFNAVTPITGDRECMVDMGSIDINCRNPNLAAPFAIWRPFLVDSSSS